MGLFVNYTHPPRLAPRTTFNGFVGMHVAVRAGVMSLTIDTRFDSHLDAGLLKWLT